MNAKLVTTNITNFLISRDKNWSRFQDFAIDLFREAEKVDYNATVQYDDRGRDARTALIAGRRIENAICCAVKDADKPNSEAAIMRKAKSDLERLKETGIPKRVTFCFNAPVTESLRDKFLNYARGEVPGALLRIEGLEYFGKAASLHPEVFLKYYHGDLAVLQQSLLFAEAPKDPVNYGLRLAIVTQFGEDAEALRTALVENMVLLSFADRKPHDIVELCQTISAELKLSRAVDESFISAQLTELVKNGIVRESGSHLMLTQNGLAVVEQIIERGSHFILDQKAAFIEELRQRLRTVSNEKLDIDTLWSKLTTALCRLMMDNGMRIAREMLGSSESATDRQSTQSLLRDLAVSALPLGVRRRRAIEVADAVFALLTQPTGFRDWLARVASAFVSMCSLGLHPAAQQQMLARMENWTVVVDTHLLLSMICESEHDHHSVQKVLSAWTRLRRRVATCDAVLEEAAYHAFAANRDFNKLWDSGEIQTVAAHPSLIENAFIRFFFIKSGGQIGHTRWDRFIFNYKGTSKFDGSKLEKLVLARGWEVIESRDIRDEDLQALAQLHPRNASWSSENLEYGEPYSTNKRQEWDVRLVDACMTIADELSDTGASILIMTRSGSIAELVKRSGTDKHGVSLTSVASLGYAMALTPGLSISLPDVQDLLLEEGLLKRAAIGLERAAKKVADRELKEGIDLIEAPMLDVEFRDAVNKVIRASHI